ncbi:MAG: spore cortex biosynthesis protein YabQ [Clostridia bacterium]|nr:spore cortex biosynthesis protein YabQ [Clostridia bacterium]
MITNQAYLFLIFVINGLLIGFIFDIFRILRISFKTKDFVTYIQDIVFWLITGAIVLYSIFVFNNGEIRLYIFLGIAIGVILYMTLFSKYIIEFNVQLIKVLKTTLQSVLKVILIPISFMGKIIKKVFFKPISFITINLEKFSTKFVKKFQKNVKITK